MALSKSLLRMRTPHSIPAVHTLSPNFSRIGQLSTIERPTEFLLAMAYCSTMNHQGGETFVTRKITMALANIAQGLQDCLYLGNLGAKRDWGHARDYVRMQWMMLQQESPEDFVIASGEQFSVRDFITMAARKIGIEIEFSGNGLNEVGVVKSVASDFSDFIEIGETIVGVNPRYFRPTEVEELLGDASKAKNKLGWKPEISLEELCENGEI